MNIHIPRPRSCVRPPVVAALAPAVLCLAAALLVFAPGCSHAPKRPNILIVVLDTVRRDAAGWPTAATPPELSRVPLTPHLSELAARGTTWSRAWSAAPWTVPSHASIFSGRLPSGHGCTGKRSRFAADVPTLAEKLAASGYATAAFYSNPWLSDRATGLLRGFAVKKESDIGGLNSMVSGAAFGDQGGVGSVEKLGGWLDARDKGRPFLAFVNILEAHLPYAPLPGDLAAVAPDVPAGTEVPISFGHAYNAGLKPDADVDWHMVRACYAADVRRADGLLGRILDLLREKGLDGNTTVIVTADHGENLGDHHLCDHQFSVHETLLAVPLVMAGPRAPGIGIVRDDPVELTDLYATALDLAGLPLDGVPAPSRSLLGDPSPPDRAVISQYAGPSAGLMGLLKGLNPELDAARLVPARRTVRVGDLRLSEAEDGGRVLNDLASDPGQERDLAAERPEDVRRLDLLLRAVIANGVSAGEEASLDANTRRQLESLGYVQGR